MRARICPFAISALGRTVKLRLEIGEEMPEPSTERPAAESIPPAKEPVPAPPAKPADPAEEFKNDPLIKKALEIFAGEIQTATK